MRELNEQELMMVDGGWIPFAGMQMRFSGLILKVHRDRYKDVSC
ncbi:lactobin A/cerein 7B family class IIb bacteriocin [Orenia metallireducens]|uniref:Class IIb bacteriocin, lactobin A/cerein 7B family n=1 Tax=Orenia metallireducens TaxID=1413210 RepID=A0A285IBH1_9FIRM|nr:class IIb bacteriocin, lactobin A/cerein 7B family [Orenia metallireducens]PRX20635.1 lactobin A/cerein 7B family class IIb bacteriocin [Orenia metallireducens]SNY45300.1 class IIb bacteriocin, lactobin A/cerein 7B family [Orenia metallireducens]